MTTQQLKRIVIRLLLIISMVFFYYGGVKCYHFPHLLEDEMFWMVIELTLGILFLLIGGIMLMLHFGNKYRQRNKLD